MTPAQVTALYEQVKANRIKLDACLKHRFNIGEPPYQLGEKFVCANCAGTIDAVQAYAYARGFEAAGGNPNEIIPGFK